MARVYKTKGDLALKAKITVTLTPALLEKIEQHAKLIGQDKTAVARMLIDSGLRRVQEFIEDEKVVA